MYPGTLPSGIAVPAWAYWVPGVSSSPSHLLAVGLEPLTLRTETQLPVQHRDCERFCWPRLYATRFEPLDNRHPTIVNEYDNSGGYSDDDEHKRDHLDHRDIYGYLKHDLWHWDIDDWNFDWHNRDE